MRTAPLALAVALAACSQRAAPSLTAQPDSVSFPDTYLGTASRADVSLISGSDVARSARLSTQGPFRVAAASIWLSPSGSMPISIEFVPTEAGDAEGTLDVELDGDSALSVALAGSALA